MKNEQWTDGIKLKQTAKKRTWQKAQKGTEGQPHKSTTNSPLTKRKLAANGTEVQLMVKWHTSTADGQMAHKYNWWSNGTQVQLMVKWHTSTADGQVAHKYNWWSNALQLGLQHLMELLAPPSCAQWFVSFHITHHAQGQLLESKHNHKL